LPRTPLTETLPHEKGPNQVKVRFAGTIEIDPERYAAWAGIDPADARRDLIAWWSDFCWWAPALCDAGGRLTWSYLGGRGTHQPPSPRREGQGPRWPVGREDDW
jgi:hypothetical protein